MACIWYMASFGVVTLCLDFASRQSSHHLYGPRRLHRIVPCLSLSLLPAPFFFSTVWASRICFVPLKTINLASSFHKTKTINFVKTAHVLLSIYVFQSTLPKKNGHFWSSMLRDVLSSVRKLKKKNFEKKNKLAKKHSKNVHIRPANLSFCFKFLGTQQVVGREIPPPPRLRGPPAQSSSGHPPFHPKAPGGSGHVNVAMAKCECEGDDHPNSWYHSVASNFIGIPDFISFALLSSSIHDFFPVASEISKSQLRPITRLPAPRFGAFQLAMGGMAGLSRALPALYAQTWSPPTLGP